MKPTSVITTIGLCATMATTAFADSYLPAKGDKVAAISISHTTFNEFWAGDTKMPGVPGGGEIERTSYRSYFYYGIEDNVSFDLSLGYADTSSSLSQDGAWTDSSIGISWQPTTQGDHALDWMLRLGANFAGDYETGFISAPGDGENGIDLSTKFGRSFSGSARGDLEIGYTLNEGDVPDSYRIKGGPSFNLGGGMQLDINGIYFSGVDGIDIGGAGFTGLGDLPKVEEEGTAAELGLSFSTDFGYYRLSASRLLDGRNIGEEVTVGLFAAYKF